MIHHLAIFDALIIIQRGFGAIPKITTVNLCKPFHDVVIIPFELFLKILKRRTRTIQILKLNINLMFQQQQKAFKVKKRPFSIILKGFLLMKYKK